MHGNRFSVLEYVWLDSKNELRSKCRTLGEQYMIDIDIIETLFVDFREDKLLEIVKGIRMEC